MNIDDYIVNAGYFILTLNTLVFVISYNEKNKALKYFIMYLMLCFLIQFYSNILHDLGQNNLFLSHYFFIGQFLFLSFFFSKLLNFKKFKILNRCFTFLIVFSFIFHLNKQPKAFERWSVFEIAITSIPLIIYSFFFFLKNLNHSTNKKYIYFNSGFFIYTLCSTLIFILGNIGSREMKLFVWDVNAFLYVFFQVLIFVEWYRNFRKPLILTSKKR